MGWEHRHLSARGEAAGQGDIAVMVNHVEPREERGYRPLLVSLQLDL